MKNWRPEGFDAEQVVQENIPHYKLGSVEYSILIRGVELGADAILEKLKEMGIKGTHHGTRNQYGGSTMDGNTVITFIEEPHGKMTLGTTLDVQYGKVGTLVFIPDETP